MYPPHIALTTLPEMYYAGYPKMMPTKNVTNEYSLASITMMNIGRITTANHISKSEAVATATSLYLSNPLRVTKDSNS